MRWLEHPVIVYLIMGVFSSAAAVIFYFAGGKLANVTAEPNTFLEVGFQAGGGLAGFIIIFLISYNVYGRLEKSMERKKRVNMRLYLVGKPEGFDRGCSYTCKYHLFDEETGECHEFPATNRWEAGFFTIDVMEVGEHDMIDVRVERSDQGKIKLWTCDYFHSRAPKTEVNLVQSA